MDPDRARIQADLSGLIDGQVRCDDVFLRLYASDASNYEVQPIGVVRPYNTEDVVACVKYAADHQLSIFPRGSGSNVVGGCLGNGLIVDCSYSMRRVEVVDRETVTVQAGLTLFELNRELASHGRRLAADPVNRSVTSIGGLIAMNSTGSQWASNGSPRDKIASVEMVTGAGQMVKFVSTRAPSGATSDDVSETAFDVQHARMLTRRIRQIVEKNAARIADHRTQTEVNEAGFNVFDLQQGSAIDLTRLIAGSEGTLGVITRATLFTNPIARHRGVSLLFFRRLDAAAQAAVEIAKMGVAACDLVDRRLLSLARETRQEFHRLIPADAEAMLLVEFHAAEDGRLREKLEHLRQRIQRKKKIAFDVRSTTQQEERDLYWKLTRRIIPALYRLSGNQRALPFIEDIAIPPAKLPEFLASVHQLMHEHEVTASIFSHTPQGLLHVRPFLNLADPADQQRMTRLANSLFEKVNQLGGTVTGSSGDGFSRSWYLRRQYGSLYKVFSEIKDVFDPQNTFNPGKIVGHPYSGLTDNLRAIVPSVQLIAPQVEPEAGTENLDSQRSAAVSTATNGALPVLEPQLQWTVPQMAMAARNCNGCARCRSTSPNERMCPLFRLAPREEASPRAKANLVRSIVTGQLDVEQISQEEVKQIADLCVNCHQCRVECPAGVDIPKLMVETKAQYFMVNGLKLSDWMLTRLDWLYEIAGRMPRVTNRLIRSPFARWLMDRMLGIAEGRKLPTFDHRNFLRWATRERLTRPSKQQSRKVVYFVDAYANWNDVELAQSFVQVMRHNGIDVLVPPRQNISAMSLIAEGAIARARKIASKNVELLAEWVRQGYQVVTTEPSAALVLKHEYLNFMNDADVQLVAKNTVDSSTYLLELHRSGDLELDFRPVNATIGYHLPCHQRALGEQIPALALLKLIPGLQVELIRQGCSGMAGTYGLKRKNYHRSLRMGLPLINAMRSPNIIAGTTECSTCKIQMEQGTTKPTIHPLKILALAYGLMPQLTDLFNRRSEELVVT